MITQNDYPSYVKHVSARICNWVSAGGGGGGFLPKDWYTTCLCNVSAYTAQKLKVLKLMFLIL